MKEELRSPNTVTIFVHWTITRSQISKELSGIVSDSRVIELPAMVDGKVNPTRRDLLLALDGETENRNGSISTNNSSDKSVLIKNALPMFLKVTTRGTSAVPQLSGPLARSKYTDFALFSEFNRTYF